MNNHLSVLNKQKKLFRTGITKTYEWRIDQLNRLEGLITDNRERFQSALSHDFKTSQAEQSIEVQAPVNVAEFTKNFLAEWMQPQKAMIPTGLAKAGHEGVVYREPFGSVLVIGPFNGPLLLLLNPAIAALSAGNTVVLKANEQASQTSNLLAELIPQYFDDECVAIVTGDKEVTALLLDLPFDFIFFTGSSKVGQIVAKAAAEKLIPTILELGGQNPVIVDETANIKDAARKLAWGFTAWGGQWCSSPGYVCVHESVAEQLVWEMKSALIEMYGIDPINNTELSRMISSAAVRRVVSAVDQKNIFFGGEHDENSRYIQPTIVYPANWTDAVMQEELFGPVLPIIEYQSIDDVVNEIQKHPQPLAAYFFSQDRAAVDMLVQRFSFGGGAVNQVNVQLFIGTMPFGGVGQSGMGNYYGRFGFESLTHAKSILFSPVDETAESLFPPFSKEKAAAMGIWFSY